MFSHNLAFVIGINNYFNGISPLKTAVNDAKKLVKTLREKHGYRVWVCLDEVATLNNLNQLLEKTLPQEVSENDRLLFYFAGHGVALNGDDGPAGYLIPQDAKQGDTNSYLPMTKLHDALTQLPCRHFLGILDCCFSGAFRWSSTRDLLTTPEVIHKERYDRFIIDPAWQIITSSASDQKALDNFNLDTSRGQVGHHSPFATALLEALEGAADVYPPATNDKPPGDGVITATELYLYLRDQVEIPTEESRLRQTPGIWCLNKHDKGEYIFLSPGHELNLPPAPPLDDSQNPYRGLKSFEEEHSELFFGRSELVDKLQDFVKTHPLTVVLGASGSGKSSLVKAGLIPKLNKETRETWCILSPIRPGETPFQALNHAVVNAKLPKVELQNQQQTLAESIAVWAKSHPNSNLLIFIDQSEEIITLCQDENERKEFFQQILQAINAHQDKLRVVLTLRSDFERLIRDASLKFVPTFLQAGNTELKNLWQSGRFIVSQMTRGELREAIEKPAEARVMYFQPHDLVEQLIDEVDNMPGALPLLSFALSELYLKYLKRQHEAEYKGITIDRALTQEDYQELGGVVQSLTQRADEEYQALVKENPAYDQVIRHIMLRMVAMGGGELTRRRVPLSELEYPEPENTRSKEVIQRFTDARLLVEGQDGEGNSYVEPAHDALVRGWQKLLEWKQNEEESISLQRRLTPAAQEWQSVKSNKQPSDFQAKVEPVIDKLDRIFYFVENLLNKTTAQLVRQWRRSHNQQEISREKPVQFLWNANPYLDVLNQKLNSEQNWFNKLEAEFVRSSVMQKRRNVNWRWLFVISVILSLSGLTIGVLFNLRKSQIRQASTLRESAEINLTDNQSLDGMIDILQAGKTLKQPLLQLFSPNSEIQEKIEGTLQTAVYTVRERNRLQGYERPVRSVMFSPDGQQLATSGDDGTARLWNIQGKELQRFEKHEGSVRSIKYHPNGQLVATAGDDGFVRLWNLRGQLVKEWNAQQGRLWGVEFSPDGNLVASEGDDGTVRLWNLQGERSVELKGHQKPVKSVSFNPNGNLIASASDDGTIRLWNFQGQELEKITSHEGPVTSLSFSPNGQRLASTGEDGFVQVWNVESKQPLIEWNAQQQKVWGIGFSPDSQQLATAGGDGTVRIWNLQGQELEKLVRHQGPVRSVSFHPNGQQLASSSDDTMVRIWDLQARELDKFENKNYATSASLSINGKQIVSGEKDGTIRLWNLQGQALGKPLKAHSGAVTSVALSPNGEKIVSGGKDGTVRLWNLQGQALGKPLKVDSGAVTSVALSPDGEKILSGDEEGIIRLWNLQGQALGKPFEGHLGAVMSVAFSPDSQQIVSGGEDGTIRLWNLQSQWIKIFQIYGPQITSVTFTPDTKRIISSDSTGRILLWNLQDPQEQLPLAKWDTQQSLVNSINLSSDGKLLTTLGSDGSVKIWEIQKSEDLIKQGCNWVGNYLKNNSNIEESDRHICDL
ncbi:MAG: caspase family protein [Scytonema sp. PMC 1069.18]|nr:caspase family protein [Scytonema sp. PMC 1069.18]MEC4885484.1 caspase family protein [Scytonema sp. PMC 1070.18]